jgi:SAM-dependent methyltransferase
MADECADVRALSFGSIAEEYDRYRPGPPPDAVAWVLDGRRGLAVEVGAGTGALTRELVRRVDRVVAVEPDRRMGGVLAARLAGVPVVVGRAEELPLVEGTAEAVVGSSMWHWVEPGRGAREAARVLCPGGVLGLMWSGPDRSEGWLAELIAGPGMDGGALAAQAAERSRRHRVELPPDAPFAPPERTTVRWQETFTTEQLVGLAGTYSGFIALTAAERARVRAELADFVVNHPLMAGQEGIELPMRCHCWRAVRI